MARQHGYKGEVSIDITGVGTTYTPVASVRSWTADFTRDAVDATCFGDVSKVTLMGLRNAKGSLEFVWDPTTTPTDIIAIAFGDTEVMLKLTPSTLVATTYFSGMAWLDCSLNVAHDGVITGTANWVGGTGGWDITTV
jgi:hypothetical protein